MIIGYDGRFISGLQTGNGIYCQCMIESLSRIDTENEYRLYLKDRSQLEQLSLGANIRPKVMPWPHRFAWIRVPLTFPIELRRHPVDLFHAQYTVPTCLRAPVVLTLHDFSWMIYPDLFPASRRIPLTYTIRKAVRKADSILTGTAFIKREIVRHFDIDEEKIFVIPYGIGERFLVEEGTEPAEEVLERYGICGEYILAVGNIHPRKNLGRLVQAFRLLKQDPGIPHQLVIVGMPLWKDSAITEQIEAAGLSKAVSMTGYVTNEALPFLYRNASLFVYPSLYEGFGFPILEAMASGVPVVASDNTSSPEVGGDAARYFDPFCAEAMAEAIEKVLDDERLRKHMIQTGLSWAGRFTWSRTAEETMRVYRFFS